LDGRAKSKFLKLSFHFNEGDTVLDLFAVSGTVGVVCEEPRTKTKRILGWKF
jgi:16S rRNA G966 N2-methylase RsmD